MHLTRSQSMAILVALALGFAGCSGGSHGKADGGGTGGPGDASGGASAADAGQTLPDGAVATSDATTLPTADGGVLYEGIGAQRLCSGCSTTYAGDLSKYDFVILQPDQAKLLPALKAKNPHTKYLMYKNVSGASDSYCCSQGVEYSWVEANHPEWFLLDTNGKRINFSDYPQIWMLDWGNTLYQQTWAKNVIAEAKQEGWDGVEMDDVNYSQRFHLGGRTIAKYPTTADQTESMRQFLAYVGPQLTKNGLIAMPNIFVEWPNGLTIWDQWITYTSGGYMEYFTKKGDYTTTTGQKTGADWDWDMSFMADTIKAGKMFFPKISAPSTDTRSMAYAHASFLMDWDGGPSSLFFYPGKAIPWNPYWTKYIGTPLGPKFQVGTAWRRNFAGGTAVVNPTTSSVSVVLEKPYVASDGSQLTQLNLGPATGAVLSNPK